jgi:phage terminase Nu1 subunit (DNA packaging protein)
MNTMAEPVIIDRPSVNKPIPRPRSRNPVTVRASELAQHLDCSRTYIGKLEADGVIQKQGDGFALDQSRITYLRYLRREHRHSPRSQADAAHVAAKTEMLQLRLMEKKRELVGRSDVDELIDGIAGVTLTALSGLPARCAPRGDLAIRRSIERVVFEVRTEIAKACTKLADEQGEPPLDEQEKAIGAKS